MTQESGPLCARLCETLVDVMQDAVIGTDAADRVALWNPGAERLYGHSAAEAVGRGVDEVVGGSLPRAGRTGSAERHDVERVARPVVDGSGAAVGTLHVHRDVTERNRNALEHNRLLAVIEAARDFIGLSDLEGQPFFLNEAGLRLAGLADMEEARGHHISEFFAPEVRHTLREELLPRLLAEGRQAWELDFFNFRTGERIPVSWDAFRVDDPDTGAPVALATITRDLRERQSANEEIQRHRRRVDTVFASITDAFYALDRDFRFSYLNDRGVTVLGDLLGEDLALDDFLGNEVFAMFPGIVGTDTERNFRRALSEGRSIAYEFLYPPRGHWFDIRVYPFDEGLAVYFIDISDRKAAEALRDRHTRQQAAIAELGVRASRRGDAVRLMEEAAAVVSRTLDVQLVAVAELAADGSQMHLRAGTGWAPDVVGTTVAPGQGSLMGHAATTEAPVVSDDVRLEERCHPDDLVHAHGVTSAAVVPITGGRAPFGALGVFSRERRRFDSDEVNFLRAIAHVLHGAIARAEMARRLRDVRDDERRRLARALHDETLQELGLALARAATPRSGSDGVDHELVATITRAGEQVRAAIHNLRLAEARAEPFAAQLGELVELHRSHLPPADCVVTDNVPDHLPRDVGINVLRVLGEALTNARRHAAASRVDVRVDVVDDVLIARVQDDGRGIDVLPAPDERGGHGIMGMRERAEALGGGLRVAPGELGGTLVELRVPLAQRRPADRARVLLVDDHAAIREAIALAFTQDDEFIVSGQAGSLAEARDLLDGVDLAIVDLQLPDGDGAELIGELRARDPHVQTLVLTAHADKASVARAVQRGAAAVLAKSTHLHEVVTVARRVRAGETVMPLDEVVELLRFADGRRERELSEQGLLESLSPREREVLQLLAEGLDGAAIARRLYISPRTQRNHVANILAKLEVHSQLQAVVFALRLGAVTLPVT